MENIRITERWDQKIFWRIVWQIGFFFKPARDMYLNKVRGDDFYAKDMEEFDA